MPSAIDLAGRRFERLVAISPVSGDRGVKRTWRCVCDCGAATQVPTNDLLQGRMRSCGCLTRELLSKARTIHGHTSRKSGRTPEYRCYRGMLTRCENPSVPEYANYGGRGISVCARWREDFRNFLQDMGRRPSSDYSIDRIDVDGNYSPDNCRWATATEQQNNRRDNRRIEYLGKTMTLSQLSRLAAVDGETLAKRLDRGWSVAKAVSTPASPISPEHRPRVIGGMCRCPACKETKPVSEFGTDRHRSDGIATYCRHCARARGRASNTKTPIVRKSERQTHDHE